MTESVQRSADDPHSKAACDWYPVMADIKSFSGNGPLQ